MRLTVILFRRNTLPNGHLYRGKDRLVKKVEPVHLRRLAADFEIEEQNMFYLRHPYLTESQSHGHSKALGNRKNMLNIYTEQSRRVFKEDVTLAERLMHMRVSEKWD